jgi:hypothetical protein
MNEITTTRMLITTAVMAAVAALFAGGANAMLQDVEGGSASDSPVAAPGAPGTIPYLSHGIGVDKSLFSGPAPTQATTVAKPGDPGTIPYLSHGIGVDKSLFSGQDSSQPTGVHAALQRDRGTATAALGLTGDSALTRVADTPLGLTGDAPAGRFPDTTRTVAVSGGDDLDWSSFGAGAGLVALVGAGIGGLWLTTRRRGGVALP